MNKPRYKIINRLSQAIQLTNGMIIWERGFVIVDEKTDQIINLEKRGFIKVRNV